MIQEKRILNSEVRFLAIGGTKIVPKNPIPGGENTWVTNKVWCNIEEVSDLLEAFNGYDKEFSENLEAYEKISKADRPFECDFPGEIASKFKKFHKLIVSNIIAGDKTIPGITWLIQ